MSPSPDLLGLLAKSVQVAIRRKNVVEDSRVVCVLEAMIQAPLSDNGSELVIVNVGDAGEEMMLDLIVETSVEIPEHSSSYCR
mmetsp:Transcript_49004/g.153887  ORF Transcript_49004/g.153887 Transcript_49004/m.153887 type:complete len:83 (-) Transcript_49004:1056-1304(-)